MADFDAGAFFKEMLKSEERFHRIKAYKELKKFMQVLGPEKARALLSEPDFFGNSAVSADGTGEDDEVLLILATSLGDLTAEVGGDSHVACLVPVLQKLCEVDETVVRDAACVSFGKVLGAMAATDSKGIEAAYQSFKDLTAGEWFTARVSACAVAGPCYALIQRANPNSEQLVELRTTFASVLCTDDAPMVRRACAQCLGSFAKPMDEAKIVEEVLPVLDALLKDEQDSVRVLAVGSLAAVIAQVGKPGNDGGGGGGGCNDTLCSMVVQAAMDVSWRVRSAAATRYPLFAKVLGTAPEAEKEHELGENSASLRPAFAELLQDAESETRDAAAKAACKVAKGFGGKRFSADVLDTLVRCASEEGDPKVKNSLAAAVMELIKLLEDETSRASLYSQLTAFIEDESIAVLLSVVTELPNTVGCLPTQVPDVLRLISSDSLARHENWRVRASVVRTIPALVKLQPNEKEATSYFEASLMQLFLSFFDDKINAVRWAAADAVGELRVPLGATYLIQNILTAPQLRTGASYFLHRIAIVRAWKNIAHNKMTSDDAMQLFETLKGYAEDKIPNVQVMAIQAIAETVQWADDTMVHMVLRKCISEIVEKGQDTGSVDADVLFWATKALNTMG